MNKKHPGNEQLTLQDIILLFVLRAPDPRKAIAALTIFFGPVIMNLTIDYKHRFKDYADWRRHLIVALDRAQQKVDSG